MDKVFISQIGVTTLSERKVLEFIIRGLKKSGKKGYVVTLNPEILVFANKNPGFKSILNNATLGLPDGIGVIWASSILGKGIKERITGVDFMKKLCKSAAKEGLVVGFLGGRGKIAESVAECLREKYPNLKVAFAESGNPDEATVQLIRDKIKDLRFKNIGKKIVNHKSYIINPHVDILFVAFGFPKQEIWMAENLKKIPVRMAMGVGGAFDMIGGKLPRAPVWVQNSGLEWLFRLIIEPWRLKRQIALLTFIYIVVREKVAFLFGKRNT